MLQCALQHTKAVLQCALQHTTIDCNTRQKMVVSQSLKQGCCVRMVLALKSQCIKGRVLSIVYLVLLIEIKSGCNVLFEMQRDGHDAPKETHEN